MSLPGSISNLARSGVNGTSISPSSINLPGGGIITGSAGSISIISSGSGAINLTTAVNGALNFTGALIRIPAAMTFPSGQTSFNDIVAFGDGHADGTTDIRGNVLGMTATGTNNFSAVNCIRYQTAINGTSGTVTTARALFGGVSVTNAMGVTSVAVNEANVSISGTGNITGTVRWFYANSGAFTSTGNITGAIRGFEVADIGRAGATTVAGIHIGALTKGSGDCYGVRSLVAAASGKWNFYAEGTAANFFQGETGIGIAASTSCILTLAASTTSISSLRITQGSAPSSPVNGDIWMTSAGLFYRANGATVGPLS